MKMELIASAAAVEDTNFVVLPFPLGIELPGNERNLGMFIKYSY